MKTLLLLLLFPVFAFSQTFEGHIQDAASRQAVAYVNIGVIGKNIGTVSDENGKFRLFIKNSRPTDTIQMSMIGYKNKSFTVQNFMEKCENDCVILFEKRAYDLAEVVVVPKNYNTKIVGNTNDNKNFSAGFDTIKLGYEMGIRMKTKKRPTFVEQVTLNIANCEFDSIFYRLNIYEVKGKKPRKNILKEPIYLRYSKADIGESIVIDLRDKGIYVEDDFLVSVEFVSEKGGHGLHFCAGFFNNKTYYRETSQGHWSTIPVGIGISATIRQDK